MHENILHVTFVHEKSFSNYCFLQTWQHHRSHQPHLIISHDDERQGVKRSCYSTLEKIALTDKFVYGGEAVTMCHGRITSRLISTMFKLAEEIYYVRRIASRSCSSFTLLTKLLALKL